MACAWHVPRAATKIKSGTQRVVPATQTLSHPSPALLLKPAIVLPIFSDHHLGLVLHVQTIHTPLPRVWLRNHVNVMPASVESMGATARYVLLDTIAKATMV